jgi:hypothetical protein
MMYEHEPASKWKQSEPDRSITAQLSRPILGRAPKVDAWRDQSTRHLLDL